VWFDFLLVDYTEYQIAPTGYILTGCMNTFSQSLTTDGCLYDKAPGIIHFNFVDCLIG